MPRPRRTRWRIARNLFGALLRPSLPPLPSSFLPFFAPSFPVLFFSLFPIRARGSTVWGNAVSSSAGSGHKRISALKTHLMATFLVAYVLCKRMRSVKTKQSKVKLGYIIVCSEVEMHGNGFLHSHSHSRAIASHSFPFPFPILYPIPIHMGFP